MQGHRSLLVWKKSMQLVVTIYRATQTFPKHELYGLVSQLRRAAVSVPSNLAEGYGRNSPKELHHFIGNSRGSLAEVETQIEIARDLEYIAPDLATALLSSAAEVGRMLTGLRDWSEAQASQPIPKGHS
jgi:four helix bundle protein